MIQCNEVNSVSEYLKSKFQSCKVLEADDLILLVELLTTIKNCSETGLPTVGNIFTISDSILLNTDRVVTIPLSSKLTFESPEATLRISPGEISILADSFTLGSTQNGSKIIGSAGGRIVLDGVEGIGVNLDNDSNTSGKALIALDNSGNLKWGIPNVISSYTLIPPSSTSTGTLGEARIVNDFRYDCVAPNTWVRTKVETNF